MSFEISLFRTLALAVPLVAAGCSRPDRPNILLISLDTLRADHLSSYGYERETTPFMDEVAGEGTPSAPESIVHSSTIC